MKKYLSAAAFVAFAAQAFAADLPAPIYAGTVPPPVSRWSGFYLGLNAGAIFENGGFWNNTATIVSTGTNAENGAAAAQAATSNFNKSGTGFAGGFQTGYNLQVTPSLLIGFETDIDGSSLRVSATNTATGPVAGSSDAFQTTATASRKLDYLGTVRGRLGVLAQPDALFFLTGGLAYGGTKTSAAFGQIGVLTFGGTPPAPAFGMGAVSKTKVGWTAGGGMEWRFSPYWSLSGQYLFYDLGSVSFASGALSTDVGPSNFPGFGIVSVVPNTHTRYTGNDVRIGLNWRPFPQ
jgi:outer membrane immunogenic protein